MGASATNKVVDLVIPSGQSVSNILPASLAYGDAINMILHAIDAADAAITYTLEVTGDFEPATGSAWRTFQVYVGGTPTTIVVPNVNTVAVLLPYGVAAATGLRIKASANVTANRTFRLSKDYEATAYGS